MDVVVWLRSLGLGKYEALFRENDMLDYIEGVGQPLSYYAHELRRRGWKEAVI
ncbi:MAG: SAM domain-containing protein [Xanthobacteraceae bacterium]